MVCRKNTWANSWMQTVKRKVHTEKEWERWEKKAEELYRAKEPKSKGASDFGHCIRRFGLKSEKRRGKYEKHPIYQDSITWAKGSLFVQSNELFDSFKSSRMRTKQEWKLVYCAKGEISNVKIVFCNPSFLHWNACQWYMHPLVWATISSAISLTLSNAKSPAYS